MKVSKEEEEAIFTQLMALPLSKDDMEEDIEISKDDFKEDLGIPSDIDARNLFNKNVFTLDDLNIFIKKTIEKHEKTIEKREKTIEKREKTIEKREKLDKLDYKTAKRMSLIRYYYRLSKEEKKNLEKMLLFKNDKIFEKPICGVSEKTLKGFSHYFGTDLWDTNEKYLYHILVGTWKQKIEEYRRKNEKK
eukprot:GHVL01033035.1.p1 GENE.GHVL01033035.1~~GHVL01033035.1.p1  ORF type:complete len:191 (+),score=58.96 GHVL01033035.1:45-617(+)